jgi:hypothetical protein
MLLSPSVVPAVVLVVTIWKNRHNEWWEWITPILALPLSLFLGVLLVRRFRQVWALKLSGEPARELSPPKTDSLEERRDHAWADTEPEELT